MLPYLSGLSYEAYILQVTKEVELACGGYVTNGATRLVCKHSLTQPTAAIGIHTVVCVLYNTVY